MTVKQGKIKIQYVADFVRWTTVISSSTNVRYISDTEDGVEKSKARLLQKYKPVAITGTMKVHSAVLFS